MSGGTNNIPLYTAYALQGLVIAAGNLVLSLCIGCHSALRSRNSYLVLFGQSLADCCFMLAYGLGGGYRLLLAAASSHAEFVPVQRCMLLPQNLLWTFTPSWSGSMLMLVSSDRLLSVLFPLEYIGFPRSYAYTGLALATLPNLVAGGAVVYTNFDRNLTVPAPCFASHVWGSVPFLSRFYYFNVPSLLGCVSIALYVFVWIGYKHSQVSVSPEQNQDQYQLKQQRRLTASLGVACLCTFFFFLLPLWVANLLAEEGHRTLSLTCYVISNLNPACNIFIYMMRHEELRQAFWALVRRQTMPEDLRMWRQNNQAKRSRINTRRNSNNVMVL